MIEIIKTEKHDEEDEVETVNFVENITKGAIQSVYSNIKESDNDLSKKMQKKKPNKKMQKQQSSKNNKGK